MKFAIVIPDGAADEPQAGLGGKTPLEAARKPFMDRVGQTGVVGRSNNVPPSLTPASDVATLSLFGYDPLQVYTGRAPLEAAAMGIALSPEDWAIRCNLVTVEDGRMRDFTAGHISDAEARTLIGDLHSALGGRLRDSDVSAEGGSLEFHPGVSYRNLLVYRGKGPGLFSEATKTRPPHDIPDRPIADHLPEGPGALVLRDLMERSKSLLGEHPVNKARKARGQRPATQVWLWGQGRAPHLVKFEQTYGKRGAIISAVDLVRGVGILLGWTRIDVPGATGYLDTDYAAKGRAAAAALANHDIVCVHVEAPDEASHEGDAGAKVKAIEQIDEHIVGPLLASLAQYDSWRILISPDHRTLLETRAHSYGMVPFALAGTGISSRGQPAYDEIVASTSPLCFEKGHELMRTLLGNNHGLHG
jgi:2,3-bisphosphoglycerate-independent phosphoglycerate mutase